MDLTEQEPLSTVPPKPDMHIAQKSIAIGPDAVEGIRGSLAGACVYQYAEAVGGSWDAAFIQMQGGHLDASVEYLVGDGYVLYREAWARRLHTSGALEPGMIAIGLPAPIESALWWGQSMEVAAIPFVRSGRELELISEPGDSITVLLVKESLLSETVSCLADIPAEHIFGDRGFLLTTREAVMRLRRTWDQVLDRETSGSTCATSFPDLIDMLLQTLDLGSLNPFSKDQGMDMVARALQIASRYQYAITIPELCQRTGVSRRTLETAFRANVKMAPHAYLTLRRLGLCRGALAEADPRMTSVTAVALQHGFTELGRFSGLYRQHFGELPSETLRQARAFFTGSAWWPI